MLSVSSRIAGFAYVSVGGLKKDRGGKRGEARGGERRRVLLVPEGHARMFFFWGGLRGERVFWEDLRARQQIPPTQPQQFVVAR